MSKFVPFHNDQLIFTVPNSQKMFLHDLITIYCLRPSLPTWLCLDD
jgi:hypothetical protein